MSLIYQQVLLLVSLACKRDIIIDKNKRGGIYLICVWCNQEGAKETVKTCTWIEPGGTYNVVVEDVPAIDCPTCNDIYLQDEMNEQVEDALNSVDLSKLGLSFSYTSLMNAPRVSIFELYKAAKN